MATRNGSKWRRWLPYFAAGMALVMLVSGVLATVALAAYKRVDSPLTRTALEAGLNELQAAVRAGGAPALRSPEVQGMMSGLPYAGMALLVDADGQIVYRKLPRGTDVLADLVSARLRRLLGSLPPGALRSEQVLVLRAIDALQAEGEHADVYIYTARLLLDGSGKPVGAVAVAYDRNPGIALDATRPQFHGASPWRNAYMIALPVFMLSLALYWLSLPLWVYLDARARGERAWLWAALALGGNLLGVVTYLLMRRTRRGACPACGGNVSAAHNACPHCGQALRATCPSCHEPLDEGWRFCPRCAAGIPGT